MPPQPAIAMQQQQQLQQQQLQLQQQPRPPRVSHPQPAFTGNYVPPATATAIAMPPQFQTAQLQQQQLQQQLQQIQQHQALATSVGSNVFNVAAAASPFYRAPAPLQLNLQAFNVLQQQQKQQQQQQMLQRSLSQKQAEPSFERPSKRINKVGGEDVEMDVPERKPDASFGNLMA